MDKEYTIILGLAKEITSYLGQKKAIDPTDQEWKEAFQFGMLLAKIMTNKDSENIYNCFSRSSSESEDKHIRKHNDKLQLSYFIKRYGCSVENPVRLGSIAYLYYKCTPFSAEKINGIEKLERCNIKNVDKYIKLYVEDDYKSKVKEEIQEQNGQEKETVNLWYLEKDMKKFAKKFAKKFILRPYWMTFTNDNVKEKGFFYIASLRIIRFLKIIVQYLFVHCKPDDIDEKAWIFQKWRSKWYETDDGDSHEDFVRLFQYDYQVTCRKVRSNKRKNFWMKAIALVGPVIGVFVGWKLAEGQTTLIKLVVGGAVAVVVISELLFQWINVKKYQETWVRHEKHRFALDIEMFCFLERTNGYCSTENKKLFMEQIMKTWKENSNRFAENMKQEAKIEKVSVNGLKGK